MECSRSLALASAFLGKRVQVIVDRPLGSRHPKHGFLYEANYGYIPTTEAPDGKELDAYFLGVSVPLGTADGICIAVVHRLNDDDDKLIVVPEGVHMTDDEIERQVRFQERWFEHSILR